MHLSTVRNEENIGRTRFLDYQWSDSSVGSALTSTRIIWLVNSSVVLCDIKDKIMVTGVGTTMPTGGVTVGATPPAQHVPQEAGQPPTQTPTTTTTRRSGENRRVSVFLSADIYIWNRVKKLNWRCANWYVKLYSIFYFYDIPLLRVFLFFSFLPSPQRFSSSSLTGPHFLLQSNKPIMEKRRRARINNCLNDLKTLILDAMKKDVSIMISLYLDIVHSSSLV